MPGHFRINQTDTEPRCLSDVLYEGQFLVLYFVGSRLIEFHSQNKTIAARRIAEK